MNVIICVDRDNGMMFHNRRQSRDRMVVKNILDYVGKRKLWMNAYSGSLFENEKGEICIDEQFLEKAEEGDYCFVENCHIKDRDMKKIILYRWDKKYPTDFEMDADLNPYVLKETLEFKGYSHDKITREVYEKNE